MLLHQNSQPHKIGGERPCDGLSEGTDGFQRRGTSGGPPGRQLPKCSALGYRFFLTSCPPSPPCPRLSLLDLPHVQLVTRSESSANKRLPEKRSAHGDQSLFPSPVASRHEIKGSSKSQQRAAAPGLCATPPPLSLPLPDPGSSERWDLPFSQKGDRHRPVSTWPVLAEAERGAAKGSGLFRPRSPGGDRLSQSIAP